MMIVGRGEKQVEPSTALFILTQAHPDVARSHGAKLEMFSDASLGGEGAGFGEGHMEAPLHALGPHK